MYDKVKLWVARTGATPDVSNFLDKAKEQIDHETGEVCIFGGFDGLKVSIYTGGISIIGSLAKYLHPNNIYTLDRHSTTQAVEKLSDGLHLPLDYAKVTGLEFGTQFVMKYPVERYISKLGDMPKLLRYHFDVGTLYYKPRGRQQPKILAFYDKAADAAAKTMELPNGFADSNLLRYEMRINGRLPQQLGVPEVTASTLSEERFYRKMMRLYQGNYFSISKNNQIKTNGMDSIKTVSDAFDVLVAKLISQSEQTQIAGFMEELREAKVFDDRNCYYRLKKKINEIAAKAGTAVPDELIKELDDEIKNVGAYV
jgi:hypothetical protein